MVWAARYEEDIVFESRHSYSAGQCGKYQFLNGSTDAGMDGIVAGVKEWLTLASDGTWGSWLQREWSPLRDCWLQDGMEKCRTDLACAGNVPKDYFTDAILCAGRKRKEMSTFDGSVSNQTQAASKLFNRIIFWENLLFPFGGLTKEHRIQRHPELVASFGPDGKMQSLGQIKYDATQGKVRLDTAVTRYTMSYDVKGSLETGAMKSAGKSLVGGFLEASALQDTSKNLEFCTKPADTFVRKHYIKSGAQSACGSKSKFTNDECASMMKNGTNCDCEVCLCIRPNCVKSFKATQCDLTTWEKAMGVFYRCFSIDGKFTGAC